MVNQSLEVHISNETKTVVDEVLLADHLRLILRRLGHPVKLNVEIHLVGDSKIAQLNGKFRNVSASTDVLSFASPKEQPDGLLGSIVISLDTADKQAQEGGISLDNEVQTLAGHGLLHLLEFHHDA